MAHVDPLWFEAAGTAVLAAESGVSMFKKKTASSPAAPTVVVNGIGGSEYLLGVLILSLAMFGVALIIHHALTA